MENIKNDVGQELQQQHDTEQGLSKVEEENVMLKYEIDELRTRVKTYEMIIWYVKECGASEHILGLIDDCSYLRYEGTFEYTVFVKNNSLYITLNNGNEDITMEYCIYERYGVKQWTGFCEDDYHGYLAFPIYGNKMLLFYYEM